MNEDSSFRSNDLVELRLGSMQNDGQTQREDQRSSNTDSSNANDQQCSNRSLLLPFFVFFFSIIIASLVFQKSTEEFFESSTICTATKVFVRLMFVRIGEIDTLNEKYQASASIESRWSIELDQLRPSLSSDEYQRLLTGKSVSLIKYADRHWHPQLFIENALGDLKETLRYSAKISREDERIYICEHRDIKGLFWEKLELHHFPSDVQDLSISIGSLLYNDKVLLMADPRHSSGVNREAFVDQQEWSLYEHVDTQQRFIKEFLLRDDGDDDDDDDDGENMINSKERHRSILNVTCHAGNTHTQARASSLPVDVF